MDIENDKLSILIRLFVEIYLDLFSVIMKVL